MNNFVVLALKISKDILGNMFSVTFMNDAFAFGFSQRTI